MSKTIRGFVIDEFEDRYGSQCSLQKSSLATEDCIWFGVDNANPKILASKAIRLGIPTNGKTTGWINYPIPDDVLLSTRMHLTQEQVLSLLPSLINFAMTGQLLDSTEETDKIMNTLLKKE
jgi:hypothetical protein